MSDKFVEDLHAERANLERLLKEAQAGQRGVGDALGREGAQQLAEAIRQAIDNIDTSLKIMAASPRP